ncbi:hypothetical protein SAMD00020551_4676 [Mesobacillus selenatarsenatis SF-1]|uniref:Uncharacterized protein n=1 Tax=Mesobacillus selenatarsenatis (strain DSM 18680 / JCM 14380 / FERM P-15431 / SF-1) TaxID=1321606 RepID=A0A0A8X980_MESS1|nr:hypothetical protein SAMD00020551_4676 [Mesobacillus selenatarsenatis SF-1]
MIWLLVLVQKLVEDLGKLSGFWLYFDSFDRYRTKAVTIPALF